MVFSFYSVLLLIYIYFFTISVVTENAKLKLALALSTGASIIVAKEATEIPPLVTIKN